MGAIAAALVLGGCTLNRSAPPKALPATPIPTFTPVLRAPTPTPTATPATNLGQAGAEQLVWRQLTPCAEEIASATKSRLRLAFASTFVAEQKTWAVQASSPEHGLAFGTWRVSDETGLVSPADEVARAIASRATACEQPLTALAAGLIPPLFPTHTPMPTVPPSPTPTPLTSPAQSRAELQVWRQLSACLDQMARAGRAGIRVAFNSSYEAERERWMILASSPEQRVSLGLWSVAVGAGPATPLDETAQAIASPGAVCTEPPAYLAGGLTPPSFATPTPAPTPVPTPAPTATPKPTPGPMVATGEQARIMVWVAIYACFEPAPPARNFTAYQDRPDRWLVEGRSEGAAAGAVAVSYGLWLVDARTGEVRPYDQRAGSIAGSSCFRRPGAP